MVIQETPELGSGIRYIIFFYSQKLSHILHTSGAFILSSCHYSQLKKLFEIRNAVLFDLPSED